MNALLRRQLTAYLGGFISAHRRERMEQVLAWRTRFLTVVLEDLYQPHNASAVLRRLRSRSVSSGHRVKSWSCRTSETSRRF